MLAYAAFKGCKPPTQLTMKFGFVEKRLEVPPEYLQRLLDVYGMLHEGVPGAICIQRLMVRFSPFSSCKQSSAAKQLNKQASSPAPTVCTMQRHLYVE